MWVLNTETNVTWEVDGELAERLAADPAYRVVDAPSDDAAAEDGKQTKKASTK
ncbi:MAG: hypothetical protein LCH85_08410 [Chloroflexi bacterium]|nr:hypothetical protein [Chloroflexota bacterium]